ncbi:restriction endonuclease subunit S [Nonomuraea sp. K274]|uniref:Restriction endonuclease subunit S n=1 Tax=Nonomuraea cypriaca TaxID=1187855 RepID=A0A931A929_9ACTN|nr:restriction endonuclease subunit S [Nonomuraea cypriaca]
MIAPPDLTDQQRVDTRRLRRIPWADTNKLSRFALQEGDLLIVRQGAVGRLALLGAEHATWFYSSSCIRIRPRGEDIVPAYLAFYLSYPPVQKELLSQVLPGTVSSINTAILSELLITVPPREQQQAIVATLLDIDAQIKIQRTIAERLETLKPAIFGEMVEETRPT